MEKVNLRIARILVLEKCSRINGSLKKRLMRAAAIFSAAALVSVCSAPAFPGVTVSGLPQWLVPNAQKSLNTIWDQMSPNLSMDTRKEMMTLVSGKLFRGYSVSSVKIDQDNLILHLQPSGKINWKVDLEIPSVNKVSEGWFRSDALIAQESIRGFLEDFPPDALTWADFTLQRKIDEVVDQHLTGWSAGTVVKVRDDATILEVSFSPAPPLVLAFDPMIDSTTIPYAFRSGLREDLLRDISSFTGLPVIWLQSHKIEFQKLVEERLSERNTVQNARATVDVEAYPDQIAQIQATVESRRYSLSAWLAVYIGADERYPEFGIHVGRIAQPFSGWDVELYGEFITKVDDIDVESRLGLRWSPLDNVWLGFEYVDPDDIVWYKILYSGSLKKPYFWWRHSAERQDHFALGWHLTQYLAIELLYDERYDEEWSIRLLNNL